MLVLSSSVAYAGEAVVTSIVTRLVSKNVVVAVVVGMLEELGGSEDVGGSEELGGSEDARASEEVVASDVVEVSEDVAEAEDTKASEDIEEDGVSVVVGSMDEKLSSPDELLQHVMIEPELESRLAEAVATGIGGFV